MPPEDQKTGGKTTVRVHFLTPKKGTDEKGDGGIICLEQVIPPPPFSLFRTPVSLSVFAPNHVGCDMALYRRTSAAWFRAGRCSTIKSAGADEIAIVIVESATRPTWTTVGADLGAAIVSVVVFALRRNASLVAGDKDVLAAIDITPARNRSAATPSLPGIALKAAITIEYLSAAGADIDLAGPLVTAVLRAAIRGQHGIPEA